jgi:hypothetical protein
MFSVVFNQVFIFVLLLLMKHKHMIPHHEHRNLFAVSLLLMFTGMLVFVSCSKESYKDETNCDLSHPTYNTDIKDIINAKCAYPGCHRNNIETFDFSSYDGVKTGAGSIINRINRNIEDPLYMPQDKTELSACYLQKLRTWVSIGAPLE